MCQKPLCKEYSTYCPTCDGTHSPYVYCWDHEQGAPDALIEKERKERKKKAEKK